MDLYNTNIKTVSIILPTYNREKYLKQAINSVINQSFNNWELIIIDDGSNDSTNYLIKTYTDKYPNIKYFFHTNRGVALSMNKGLELSRGDYITFIGSDDEYLEDHLKLRIDFFSSHPNIELTHSTVKIIGDEYVKDKNDLTKKIHLNNCIIGGTLFGKKKVFRDLNGFSNVRYSPESEFMNRAQNNYSIVKLDIPTYVYYRNTPDSICNNI